MITKQTAADIWSCYREIEAGKKLLEDLVKAASGDKPDEFAPKLRDAFGRKRNLQMGIPSGDSSHRIFDVNPKLALSVIRSHIAEQEAELVHLNETARIELDTVATIKTDGEVQ